MEKECSEGPLLTPTEERIFELARPCLQVRDNERHTRNALLFATGLLKTFAAEKAIVVPATILHDVGWSRLSKEMILKSWGRQPDMKLLRLHEEEGAKIALSILSEVDYDRAVTTEIIEIIRGHDTRTSPLSLNDKIVKDADKLTRYDDTFWFLARELSIPYLDLAAHLELLIDQWFFLDLSRDMARAELAQRRLESSEMR